MPVNTPLPFYREMKPIDAKTSVGGSFGQIICAPIQWRGGLKMWLGFLLLVVGVGLSYQQVWSAGYIWDDDAHVIGTKLQNLTGLWRIWTEPGATQQYYPVVYSVFWLEKSMWGDSSVLYHLSNFVWHGLVAFLLFRLLSALDVRGAFLAAWVFALHPVCVESVAWISEQKNTVSAIFYLCSALVYLRYDRERRMGWYILSTGLFVLALLSKSVTATLPAALLVVFWWRRGRLGWKSDVVPLFPWFIMAAAAGATTAWFERTHVGASGAGFELGVFERMILAGRVVWFYIGKIFWPVLFLLC